MQPGTELLFWKHGAFSRNVKEVNVIVLFLGFTSDVAENV